MNATKYYVSSSGNDNYPGTSANKPIKSIEKVNNLELKPGDSILFHKGETFMGELTVKYSGTVDKPIVFSSYGEDKSQPIITGALPIEEWNVVGENLFRTGISNKVHQLYTNQGYLNIARTPNSGFLYIENGDNISLSGNELSGMPDLTMATARVQTVNWQWEIRKVVDHQNSTIIFDSLLWHSCKRHFGYYLENLPEFMDKPGEWFYDPKDKTLSLIWDKDITRENFKAVIFDNGMKIRRGIKNISISNLAFSKFNESAINAAGFCENIDIMNNSFSDIEIFGVFADTAASNWTVANNSFVDILGRGISLMEPQNCTISGNEMKRIGMIAGHGFDGVNSGVAICIENNEFRSADYKRIAMHNKVADNRIDSTGYGAIRVDGAYNTVEYNVVYDAVLTMNDGGGIYCWGNSYDYTHHNIFRKNIVVNVHGNMTSCAGNHKIITCMYMDNYSNNNLIEDNILVGAETGIILNDLSQKHEVRNNIIYDIERGISISIWKRSKDSIRGNFNIKHNTIYPHGEKGRAIQVGNNLNIDFPLGDIDSNLYVSPVFPMFMQKFNVLDKKKVTYDFEMEGWIADMDVDHHSSAIVPGPGDKWWQMEDDSFILINDTREEKTFDIGVEVYSTLDGQWVNGIVTLEPFTARVFYRK